jgi:hypothetical protein
MHTPSAAPIHGWTHGYSMHPTPHGYIAGCTPAAGDACPHPLRYASLKLPNTAGWYRGIVDTLCCYTGGIPREWRQSAEDLGPPDLGYRCGHGEIHAVAVRARAPARTHARTRARARAPTRAHARGRVRARYALTPQGPGTPYWVRCGRDGAGGPDRASQGLPGPPEGPSETPPETPPETPDTPPETPSDPS